MIVVTGATGNVGQPLAAALSSAGVQFTMVSRNAPSVVPPGARHVPADLAALGPALRGADALFLLVPPAGVDGAAVLASARAAGVSRIVLLSSHAAGLRSSHAALLELEELVKASGLAWTVLRPGGFASNAFAWAASIRAERRAFAPFGDVALPVVDPADIAAVAAAALLDDRHAGQTYVLTGPEPTTPRERVRAIASALGAPVAFVEQTAEQARAEMVRVMPASIADGTLGILGQPLPAEVAVSPDVSRVLGRPAAPFAAWAERNVMAFQG
ncbi:NAD(P)H-binding protein [Dactylosporangium sp. CA-233914]|uniref:NAD(P)H-binding protein n=1 Tax=Dactylosporangium sp. CA-233914 TaxID=3239934 RepID=UPI003D8AC621